MTFTQLLAAVGAPDGDIQVSADSRRVRGGDVFVAVPGTHSDGMILSSRRLKMGQPILSVKNPLIAARPNGLLSMTARTPWECWAQAAEGNPNAQLTNLAVTGTNGKTTVTFWCVR